MSKPVSVPRELPDEGTHNAVCKIVADLGTVKATKEGWKDRKVILLLFELVDESTKDKPVYQTIRYTFTAKSKNLKKAMKAWQGVKDLADYDMADCLNKPALITIEHNDSGEYANITAITAPQKGPKIAKGFMTPHSVFLDETFDQEEFEELPEWIQNLMMESDEFVEVSDPQPKRKSGGSKGKPVAKPTKRRGRDEEEEEEEEEDEDVKPKRKVRR